jgi:acyl carrier protein
MQDSELFSVVQEVLSDSLDVEPGSIRPDTRLMEDLDADSLAVMDIVVRMNRRLGLKISMRELRARLEEGAGESAPAGGGAIAVAQADGGAGEASELARRFAEIEDRSGMPEVTVQFVCDLVAEEMKANVAG